MKHCIPINPNMIIKKDVVGTKTKRDGTTEEVTEFKLNIEYWKSIKEPINVVLDEAHSIINSRRAMSKVNVIMSDWIALIRRVLGAAASGYGELVLISQLPRRLDPICRDMASQVRYHVCHYKKQCRKCLSHWRESSETPEGLWLCPKCGSDNIKKFNHKIEVWHFANMNAFETWDEYNAKTFYKHYLIEDIEKYFPLFDTLQWDNMFSELY